MLYETRSMCDFECALENRQTILDAISEFSVVPEYQNYFEDLV